MTNAAPHTAGMTDSEIEEIRRRAAQDERERKRYLKVAWKCKHGGDVRPADVDDFCGIAHGSTMQAIEQGLLECTRRKFDSAASGRGRQSIRVDGPTAVALMAPKTVLNTRRSKAKKRSIRKT